MALSGVSGAQTSDPSAYLARLERAGPDGPSDAARLVVQAWPALPDSVRRSVGGAPGALRPGAGVDLAAWWHAQDPLPATPENEAVAEHLRRVELAVQRYPRDDERGYDDRGAVLVLLGEPREAVRLRSRTLELVASEDLPDNELWSYGPGGPAYLFVRRSRSEGWREGSLLDAVPFGLRSSTDLPQIVNELVPKLAVADPSYGTLWAAADRAVANELLAREGRALPGDGTDRYVVETVRFRVRSETRRAVRNRDATTERTGPPVPLAVEIPLAVRTARFRAANGGLRVEVVWAPEPGAYVGLRGPHTVRSVATLTEAGRPARLPLPRVARTQALPPSATRPGATTPAETTTLGSVGRGPGVAVQVDVADGGGAVVRRAVRRVGRLAPLAADGGGLVVSDPLPHLLPPGAGRISSRLSQTEAEHLRYPYNVVAPGATLGVYVEAYDLGLDGGRSRYEVERAVHRVRDGERTLVSLSATESGTSFPTARELIVLPVPGDVRPGDAVEFSGTIRDLVTGRSGTWALAFGVAQ